jgi:hypothetical protein
MGTRPDNHHSAKQTASNGRSNANGVFAQHRISPEPRGADQRDPGLMTSTAAITRVERTCADLQAAGHTVTFTGVAARAGLSRTTLCRNPELRALVEHHRSQAAPASSLSRHTADIASLTKR